MRDKHLTPVFHLFLNIPKIMEKQHRLFIFTEMIQWTVGAASSRESLCAIYRGWKPLPQKQPQTDLQPNQIYILMKSLKE
jgi:hypothetical protein